MLSLHDCLLLNDLRFQPRWLSWAYLAIGVVVAGIGLLGATASRESLLCVGGGFLVALGAEKLVTQRIRTAAAHLARHGTPP